MRYRLIMKEGTTGYRTSFDYRTLGDAQGRARDARRLGFTASDPFPVEGNRVRYLLFIVSEAVHSGEEVTSEYGTSAEAESEQAKWEKAGFTVTGPMLVDWNWD